MSQQQPDQQVWPSRLIEWGVLVVMLYSVWVWAGLRPSFHVYALYASLPIGLLLLLVGPAAARRAVWRDPVFWLGLLFNGYLILQWSNAGRELYLDPVLNKWIYSDPPRPGWPFSFNAAEAWQMVTWFVPAWLLLTAIRSPHIPPKAAIRLLTLLVISAGLLGAFGLIQHFSGTRKVYGITPFSAGFYASFAYRNHAGSFFSLMALTGAALFYRQVFCAAMQTRSWTTLFLLLSVLLCIVSLVFCGSRAAVFFFIICLVAIIGSGLRTVWQLGTRVQRLHAITLMLVILMGLAAVIHLHGREVLQGEFRTPRRMADQASWLQARGINLDMSPEARILLAQAGWEMWKGHPWFGVGGWGYRYKMAFYIPESQWGEIRKTGRANVHVDILQYLAEFGLIGFSLLALMLLIPAGAMVRSFYPTAALGARLASLGLTLVVIHSFIDIPFRSPGVLYHWLAVMAILPSFRSEIENA